MNITQLQKYLSALGIHDRVTKTSGWMQIHCPLAPWTHQSGRDSNPSFGIKMRKTGQVKCKCFSCGFHGDLSDLVFELRKKHGAGLDYKTAFDIAESDDADGGLDLAFLEEEEAYDRNSIYYYDESWLDTFPICSRSEYGVTYLRSRQVPDSFIGEFDIRFDPSEKRVAFPVRDFDGELVGLHGKAVDKDTQPPYRMYPYQRHTNPIVWYGEAWVDLDAPIIVVESIFDLLRVYELYQNVICPLSASLTPDKIARVSDALSMVLMFDSDKAGRKADYMMRQNLPNTSIQSIWLKEGTDPGDTDLETLENKLYPFLKIWL